MLREFLQQSNYIENERSKDALEDALTAYGYLESLQVDMRFHEKAFRNAHYFLMHRLNASIAGLYRTIPVTVGGCLKPFISLDLLVSDMELILMDIKKSIKDDIKKPKEYKEKICKEMHIRFEYLHPFEDGNGRMGRILLNLHRRALKLPFLIIKESEKDEYYKWF
jgi:fido (protein-threonine AMPylation protein)